MRRPTLRPVALLLLSILVGTAWADNVPQRENVSYEYARVLKVSPVFQTLTATSTEEVCDDGSRISRVVGKVRGALRRDKAAEGIRCRAVPVERQFRRAVAFDVDYTHGGAKYRSRLPQDPGRLLRIRVAVAPAP